MRDKEVAMMGANDEDGLLPHTHERTPVPDPTRLTTAAIEREITRLREQVDNDWASQRLLLENKFQMIDEKIEAIERVRREMKEDHVREIQSSQRAQDVDRERMRYLSEERLTAIRRDHEDLLARVEEIISSHRTLSDAKLQAVSDQLALNTKQRDEQKRDAEKNVETARQQAEKALSDFMERYQRAHDELWNMTKDAIEQQRIQQHNELAALERLFAQQNSASELAISKSEAATSEQLRLLTKPIDDLKERVSVIEARRLGASENRVEIRDTKAETRGNLGIWIAAASVVLTIVLMIIENSVKVAGH